MKDKKTSSNKRFYIIGLVIITYLILFYFNKVKTIDSFTYAWGIFIEIIPILGLIYIFMVIFNFIPEKKLRAYMQKTSGFYQYLILSLLGMISHGPIYAWYPILSDLKTRGLTYGSIGAYLFSKGIKLTLIPLMIYYFGAKLTVLFSATLFSLSFIQAFLIDLFMNEKKSATPVE
ncbi:MAG: hypothetical protein JW702_08470 [Clostridiales bacterium]|nr:hypothetical protein [Clostridiales bacterium]